jgi:ectoine hydroxylase-related dioxygenase (phytanoyl-CoA dioxygenase family)
VSLFDHLDLETFGDHRDRYERDGVVHVPGVFGGRWLALLEETVAAAVRRPSRHVEYFSGADDAARFFADAGLVARFPAFATFLRESPAAELAARLMRSTVARLFFEQILVKEPGAAKRTPWHQDLPYWPIAGTQVCSMWIPVDAVAKDVSVRFVAGSHRWVEHNPCDFHDGTPYGHASLPLLPDIDAEIDAGSVLSFEMAAGDCLIFHAMTAHGAPGNAGATQRRAVSIRWAGDDVHHHHRPGRTAERSVGSEQRAGQPLDDGGYPAFWSSPTS